MISGNVLSIGSPQVQVHSPSVHEQRLTVFDVSPLDDLVAFSSQPTKLSILRQVVE